MAQRNCMQNELLALYLPELDSEKGKQFQAQKCASCKSREKACSWRWRNGGL